MTDSHLVSAEELAQILSLPLQSIWRGARLGMIPSYRFGVLYRFDVAEVLEAMRQESRCETAVGEP